MLPDVGSTMMLPGLQDAALLGVFDHREGDAVLDRAARVLALELDPDLDARVEELVDAQLGRVADESRGCCLPWPRGSPRCEWDAAAVSRPRVVG